MKNLKQFLKKEIKNYLMEETQLYTGFTEKQNPTRIVVTLKNGKKISISKKSGFDRNYDDLLTWFKENRVDILNKIITKMITKLK